MPRSYYDDSPPRSERRGGGGTRVAEYDDLEIRASKGKGRDRERERRDRPEWLDDDHGRDEPGPLVVREEEIIEERHRGGGRDKSRNRDRSRRRRGSSDDEESVTTERTERSRRHRSHERTRDMGADVHLRGPHGGKFDLDVGKDDVSTRSGHSRRRSRDFVEDASLHLKGPFGTRLDVDYDKDKESDSHSRRKSRGGDHGGDRGGERTVRETEEEIVIEKGREPERRRKHRDSARTVEREVEEEIVMEKGREPERRRKPRDSDRNIEREVEEEEIVYRPKRQPREVVNEEWVYYPKPREPSPPVIARETEEWVFQPRRYDPPPGLEYRDENISIRERESGRGGYEEDIRIRERSREPMSPRGGYEEIRISEREREPDRPPPRARPAYDEEIRITSREQESRPPPRPRSTHGEEIRITERDREGSRGGYHEEDITIRERDRDREAPRYQGRSEELVIRRSSPSPTRTERSLRPQKSYERESNTTVRGDNEIIIRREERDETRSRAGGEREEIVIRRNERSRSPSPRPAPREPIRAPPIHQEIVTHHRHIDHGYEYQPTYRAPPPPPPPPEPPREEEEIDIRRTGTRDGRRYEEDLIIDRRREPELRAPAPRQRATSMDTRPSRDRWEIADVPNSERMRVNGGGESQEITWSRTNGVRRSEEPPERQRFVGVPTKEDKMWTEITKDLVIREALEDTGYDFEETESFFYVMDYLKYEDVRRLVRHSDDMRAKRKERIRQLEWEQKMPPGPKSTTKSVAARSTAGTSPADGKLTPANPSIGRSVAGDLEPPPRAISERSWDEERERIVEREYFGSPPPGRGFAAPPPPPSHERRRPRDTEEERITIRR